MDIRRGVSFRSFVCLIDWKGTENGGGETFIGRTSQRKLLELLAGNTCCFTTIRIQQTYHHGFDSLKTLKPIYLYWDWAIGINAHQQAQEPYCLTLLLLLQQTNHMGSFSNKQSTLLPLFESAKWKRKKGEIFFIESALGCCLVFIMPHMVCFSETTWILLPRMQMKSECNYQSWHQKKNMINYGPLHLDSSITSQSKTSRCQTTSVSPMTQYN